MEEQSTATEYLVTDLGCFRIRADESAVTEVSYLGENPPEEGADLPNPVTRTARAELEEYFAGKRMEFTCAVRPAGTEFQRAVWEAARTIPCGSTVTYGELAAMIGNPKASRGVGQALHRNPVLIMIPCHRVVGKGGTLTGFGAGLPLKAALLALEHWNTAGW